MSEIKLCLAKVEDCSDILDIYAPYVEETAITFEYSVPSLEEYKDRLTKIIGKYPFILCKINGETVGFAYANRQKERSAYQWNAELSIYVKMGFYQKGIGTALYNALIRILTQQNIKNIYGCVTIPNEKSEKLHAHFGFKSLGIYHKTGYKFDRWYDVVWFEKYLGEHTVPPKPFIPIDKIDSEFIQHVFDSAAKNIKMLRK